MKNGTAQKALLVAQQFVEFFFRDGTTGKPVIKPLQAPENMTSNFYAEAGAYFILK